MTCKPCPPSFARMARHTVAIKTPVYTRDEYGGQSVSFNDTTYRAIVEPASGNERFINEQLRSQVSHKITIRFQSSLADTAQVASYKLTLDGRTHQILYSRNLHKDMKTYGRYYIQLFTSENALDMQS